MRGSARTWSWISLVLLIAGALCLWLDARRRGAPSPAEDPVTAPGRSVASPALQRSSPFRLMSAVTTDPSAEAEPPGVAPSVSTTASSGASATNRPARDKYHLANTEEAIETLAQTDSAILLENAFIDTAAGRLTGIPAHLEAPPDSRGYLVQMDQPLDRAFYDALTAAGAQFVAYVPNHTALVQVEGDRAGALNRLPGVRNVQPYAPYFKLSSALLPLAVEQQPLAAEDLLQVVLYPGTRDRAFEEFTRLGVEVFGESRSPFGPWLSVQAPADSLVALAQLPEVQRIERLHPRTLLNDLARVRVNVSTNAATNTSYLGLTGNGFLVNVNDTGVDASHPALTGRVTTTDTNSFTLVDPDGHGTHVAGTLAGDGTGSEKATNVLGSLTGAVFAGMATEAEVYALPIDLNTGPLVSDAFLQENAATEHYLRRGATNALVSNNSWAYQFANTYDIAAASYDSAARDALPEVPGMQPILFVFAAGNNGNGNNNGLGGQANSILSPATGKNVITVGAIEQPRFITNAYFEILKTNDVIEIAYEPPTSTNGIISVFTNQPFLGFTDSDRQVAAFSSRGNVGLGREGTHGRFKPDVVAPGAFLMSARSAGWRLEDNWPTNAPEFPLLEDLNESGGPDYRYETGTSMSAPVISGMLVLIQEFLEKKLEVGYGPALLKALLLHGTRPVNSIYGFEVRTVLANEQGWGLPNLTNCIPEVLDTDPESDWPLRFYADYRTNALGTGHSHTWTVSLSEEAKFVPFRATLVWTDPPGNPGAAIKLVNDLDLVITNLNSGLVYYGNYFVAGAEITSPRDTNSAPVTDFVNNVETVVLNPEEGVNDTNELQLSITVQARRVNVNAVTANTADVVQDYALVFSAGDLLVTNPIEQVEWELPRFDLLSARVLTNGVAELKQRAGANFQLAATTNGFTNQWSFYVFTNTFFTNQNISGLTNGSNVAFITFLPPNLSRPRNVQSDIDLYISTNAGLLTLNPLAMATADKSLKRTGTELVVYTNALLDSVYYVAVKAEDQQASEFGLVVLSTDLAFSDTDEFGNQRLFARGVPIQVPDGSPDGPGGVLLFAFPTGQPVDIVRAQAEVDFAHESVGDLQGILSHAGEFVVLHNHNTFGGGTNNLWSLIYEDNPSGNFPGSQPSDGPGSLNNFIGQSSEDVWMFAVTDDAPGRTGYVNRLTIRLTPNRLGPGGVIGTVQPNQWDFYFIDVPIGAVSLTVTLEPLDPQLPLDLYLRRDAIPDFDNYDKKARIPATGGSLTLSIYDAPPLNPGRYFVGVYNPNSVAVTYRLSYSIEINLNAVNRGGSASLDTPINIPDDAMVQSTIFVADARPVIDLQVGVRVEHPRASDLVFHLISPQGTRVLLAENRGGHSTAGYGYTLSKTNIATAESEGGFQEHRNVIDTGVRQGTLQIQYEFYPVPDRMRIYYDGARIHDTGEISGNGSFNVDFGPGSATNIVIVMNEGGSSRPTTRWIYTATILSVREAYTVFTEQTNLTDVPIKFAAPPFTNSPNAQANTNLQVFLDGFENYSPGTYSAPSPLGFWRVSSGTVNIQGGINTLGVTAFEGTNFVEFVPGLQPAAIEVDIGTTRLARYFAQIAFQRNPTGPAGAPQAFGIFVNGSLVRWVQAEDVSWGTATAVWEATSTVSIFELRTTTGSGPLIDAVRIFEILDGGQAYFFPEEDMLKPLKGELPLGNWTLEVTDNRVGGLLPGTPPSLLSWTIGFIFANTNPPVTPLRPCQPDDTLYGVFDANCIHQTNVVAGDQIVYFLAEAPLAATVVTNLLLSAGGGSGDLVLLFNSDGLPNGALPNDVIYDTANPTGEIAVIRTNPPPPNFTSGQRYYLGVANADPTETNFFFISAEFDQADSSLVTAPFLLDRQSLTNTIQGTNVLQYFQWQVASNAATHVTFDLIPQNGNVDLFVRKARPVANPLPQPNPGLHDYASRNAATNAELIVVSRVSQPLPLDDGLWYVGISNLETNPVTYVIEAREWYDLVTLTNTLPYLASVPATNGLRYYHYTVSEFATNVEFRVESGDGDVNLYVSRVASGPLPFPGPGRFEYASLNTGTNAEIIRIDYASPVPLQPVMWILAVENADPGVVNYQVTASEISSLPSNVIVLSDGVPRTHTLPAGAATPTYFLFSATQDLPAALFELYNIDQNADLLLEWGQPPIRGLEYRRSSGTPAAPPQIVLRTASGDPVSILGDWYLEVVPSLAQDLTFTIRAATPVNGMLPSGRPFNLRLTPPSPPGSGWTFNWNTVEGERYVIEWSTDLGNWTLLTTVTATGSTETYIDTSTPPQPMLFYRIRQVP